MAKRPAAGKRQKKRSSKVARAKAKKGAAKARKSTAKKRTVKKGAAKKAARRGKKAAAKPSRLAAAATLVRGAAAGAVVAIADRLPWSKDENDPIVLLETDHRRFEKLLEQGEATTERAVKGRTEILATLKAALEVHEEIEEKILYPALKSHPEAREIVLEGYQEHHVADLIIEELRRVATDNEKWGAKFKVLKENIEHHIEEEEDSMFPKARGIFSREELQDLGARMKAMRAKLSP